MSSIDFVLVKYVRLQDIKNSPQPILHTHPYYQFFIPSDRCIQVVIQGGVHCLQPGKDLLVAAPGVEHDILACHDCPKADESSTFLYDFAFSLDSPDLDRALRGLPAVFSMTPALSKEIFQLIGEIMYEVKTNRICSVHVMEGLMLLLLSRMVRSREIAEANHYRLRSEPDTTRTSESVRLAHEAVLRNAEAYIRAHLEEEIRLNDISDASEVCKNTLNRVTRLYYGMSVMDLVQRIRIEHAKELLETSTLPIVTIAERYGFRTASYFTRIFRESTGVTPSAYRRDSRTEGMLGPEYWIQHNITNQDRLFTQNKTKKEGN